MKYYFILLFIAVAHCSFGQNFQTELAKHFRSGDTLKQREILEKWEKENSDNPELYINYFNFYLDKAKREITAFSIEQSTKNEKEHINSDDQELDNTENQFAVNYEIYTQNALQKIEKGIGKYPDRLDMRLGKIYVLAQNANWNEYTSEIIRAVRHSSTNNNLWAWTNNEELPGGKSFFLSTLRTYQSTLFKTGEDSLILNVRAIANEIFTYYPTNTESLTNISLTYILTNDYDRGMDYLLVAEKINPKDAEVLSNIAHTYVLKKENSKAIKYYKKVMKQVDKVTAASIKEEIEKLKK